MSSIGIIVRAIAGPDTSRNTISGIDYAIVDLKDQSVLSMRELRMGPAVERQVKSEGLHSSVFTHDSNETFIHPAVILSAFVEDLDRYVDRKNVEGRLPVFAFQGDFQFELLAQSFRDQGFQSFDDYFWYPPICLRSLSMHYLVQNNIRARVRKYSLNPVCKELGILGNTKIESTHNLWKLLTKSGEKA